MKFKSCEKQEINSLLDNTFLEMLLYGFIEKPEYDMFICHFL